MRQPSPPWCGRRRLGGGWHRTADADGGLAQQTRHHSVAVVFLHEHEFPALRIRTLDGEDAGHGRRVHGGNFPRDLTTETQRHREDRREKEEGGTSTGTFGSPWSVFLLPPCLFGLLCAFVSLWFNIFIECVVSEPTPLRGRSLPRRGRCRGGSRCGPACRWSYPGPSHRSDHCCRHRSAPAPASREASLAAVPQSSTRRR